MKTKIHITMLMLICCISMQALATSFSEKKLNNLVNALTNNMLVVGAFDARSSIDNLESWHKLRNGEDIWTGFYQLSLSNQLFRIMKTASPIRGDFDRLIIFTEGWGGMDLKYENFMPTHGSKWVLLLVKQFNEEGELSPKLGGYWPEAEYTQTLLNEYPFLKPDTLFKVYDHSDGAFQIGWEEPDPPDAGEEIYSTNLVTRLQEIVAAPDFPPDVVTLRQQVEDALFECFLGHYTPPIEEPDEYVTISSNGKELSINERKIKNLVNAFTNAALQIGAFNVGLVTAADDHWFLLRNGEDVWDYVIRFHSRWRMMETASAIRGNFDQLIFFTEDWVSFRKSKYFMPIWQTKWILILENQFDEMGNLLPGSEYTPEILNENPFFNPETLFKVYDHRYGSFYLNWEEGRRPADGEEMYSTNLVTRLQEIVAAPDFPPDAAILRQQVEDALFECFLGTYTPPPETPEE